MTDNKNIITRFDGTALYDCDVSYLSASTKSSRKVGQEALYALSLNEKVYHGSREDLEPYVRVALNSSNQFPVFQLNAFEFLGDHKAATAQISKVEDFLANRFTTATSNAWLERQILAPLVERELRRELTTINIQFNRRASHVLHIKKTGRESSRVKVALPDFFPEELRIEFTEKLNRRVRDEVGIGSLSVSYALYKSSLGYQDETGIFFFWSEKQGIIESLVSSGTFRTTHSVISELGRYKEFTRDEILRLVHALKTNNQVHWIAEDSDVANFFLSLESKYKGEVDELLSSAFRTIVTHTSDNESV